MGLVAGKAGSFFLVEAPMIMGMDDGSGADGGPSAIIHRFDLAKRKLEKFVEGATQLAVSDNGEKLLYGR